MPLLTLRNVTAGFGGPPLLDAVDVAFEPGDRVAIVGRNGTGKSTFLGVLDGDIQTDSGDVLRLPDLRIARLAQIVPSDMSGSVFEVIATGIAKIGDAIATHHAFSQHPARNDAEARELERAENLLHDADGWTAIRRVETVISRLGLDGDDAVGDLSAGVQRRVLLGSALASDPDLLLLDEPTNHLDIDSIRWLEGFLTAFRGSVVFVTHDRSFLEAVATRILDLDRGQLRSYECDWNTYLVRKQETLEAEAEQQRLFDKKLAEEEIWIRKGVKERRKRNMGRVRELMKMRTARRERRDQLGSVQMVAQEAERSGRLVIEAKKLSFAYGEHKIIEGFSTTIQRGDRIGILGSNGAGKTTLLRLLLGELEPDGGSVRHGTRLEIAYSDQLHSALDEEKSVADNVVDGVDKITVGGKPRHIIGYLQDFLFSPIEARSLVNTLSGGERNRLLLARLFARPSNVLVLDEPTNDLDMETLDLLEELLLEYAGTVLVVSHDRAFLDHVVTSTIAFEAGGVVKEYVGGYTDWVRQKEQAATGSAPPRKVTRPEKSRPATSSESGPKRLTYMEKKELEELPASIEKLEESKQNILATMQDPAFYSQDRSVVDDTAEQLSELETILASAYERWQMLEERDQAF